MKKINLIVFALLLGITCSSCETENNSTASLNVPAGLNAEVNSAKTRVTLSWQAVANAGSYELYVALDDTSSYSVVTESFVMDDFTYNTDYHWAVRTMSGETYSQWSEVSVFRVNTESGFKNNPLPKNPGSLKILGIGNSFTDDGMEYLPNLLKSAGIGNVMLGKLSLGGSSLQQHYSLYQSNTASYDYVKSFQGNSWQNQGKSTFRDAVANEAWDIIIIQQVSQNSGQYDTYQPYLNNLISAMMSNCSNPEVCLGWQMTWAYSSTSSHSGFANYNRDQATMYNSIVNATRTMIVNTGIDLIIPSATAVQNIRSTSLNNPPSDLTTDGYHMDWGAGRYTVACTWFQALIAPCLGTTVAGNTFTTSSGNVPVTAANAPLCQKAAQHACIKRFEPSVIE
jgi:hypothetical protein